jgi:hypothetical protein
MSRGREQGYCGTYFVATIDMILIKVLNNLKETIATTIAEPDLT